MLWSTFEESELVAVCTDIIMANQSGKTHGKSNLRKSVGTLLQKVVALSNAEPTSKLVKDYVESQVEERKKIASELAKVTATEAKGYRKAFHMMDIDNSKTIEVCAWVWWCTR